MSRIVRSVGVFVAAMLVLSLPAAAFAEKPNEITAFNTATEEHETALLHGEQTFQEPHLLTIKGSSLACQTVTFTSELFSGTDNELTVEPTYEDCEFDSLDAHVDMTTCDYRLDSFEFEAQNSYTADADIRCDPNDAPHIKVTLFGGTVCEISLAPVESLTHVNIRNVTADTIGVTFHLHNMEYTMEGSFCPEEEEGTFTDATYEGDTLVNAENSDGGLLDLKMAGNTPEKE